MNPGILHTLHAAGRGITIKIEADSTTANNALHLVEEHLRSLREESGGTSVAIERVKGALETVGLYMGIREAIDGLKEMTVGSLELGESLSKMHEKSGLSVESLSVLRYASKVTGSDFEALVASLSKFENTIGKAADGDVKASAFMRSLGLDAKDLATRSDGAEVAFHKFLTTLAATENPIERNRLAMGLLGKAGAEQIPVLLNLAQNWDFFEQKARAAGVLLTAETAEQLASTNQRLEDLKQHLTGAGLALTEGLSPALTAMLGVMSSGQSQMETMRSWGENIGRVLAFIAEAATTAAAGIELAFSAVEGGKLTKIGAQDYAEANRLYEEAKRYYEIAQGKAPQNASSPFIPKPAGEGGGGGFHGADATGKSGNPIAEAAARLQEEQANEAADLRKAQNTIQLAELEAQHKMLLVSDADFYQQKLTLELASMDAEQAALAKRRSTLEALAQKQHGDGSLKRGRDGKSAEELKTAEELLKVQEQMDQLSARRGQATSQNTAEVYANQMERQLATLRIAAELEKERGRGTEHQIALIEEETRRKVEQLNLNGDRAGAADTRANADILAQKLRIADVDREIQETEGNYNRQAQAIEDSASKGRESKLEAEHELNALRQQEAADLTAVVSKYDALAQTLGGPFKEKAAELQAELLKLETPDRHVETEFGKKLAEGFGNTVDSIASKALEGRESVAKMAQGILHDMESMALKLSEQKFVLPLFQDAFGVPRTGEGSSGFDWGALLGFGRGGGGSAAGAMQHAPAALTPPTIYTPSRAGGGGLGAIGGGILTDLAKAGGSLMGHKSTVNVVNNSSNPVSVGDTQSSFDSYLRESVTQIFLTDHAEGGPMSQLTGSNN